MQALWSSLSQIFPPRARWSVSDIPDLSGKVALVTGSPPLRHIRQLPALTSMAGGNAGTGRETVKALLAHNADVYLAARSESKARQAIAELKAETGREARFLELDLADLAAVKASAERFLSFVSLNDARER